DRMESMSAEGVPDLTVRPVPDPHVSVTSRGEFLAVGAERNGIRRPELADGVARAFEHWLAGRRQVPDLHRSVRADGGQVLAVGVERDADNRILMRVVDGLNQAARPAVPDLDSPVPAPGGQVLAVRAESYADHFGLVPDDQRLYLTEPHQVTPFPPAQVFR